MTQAITKLLLKPQQFFEELKETKLAKMPYITIVFILYALSAGIDRVDTQLIKYESGISTSSSLYDGIMTSWGAYWLLAMTAGVVGGIIWFYIGSWFYNVRIKWSKGDDSPDGAKKLFLYNGLFVSIILIITTLVDTLWYTTPGDTFDINVPSHTLGEVLLIFLLVSMFHSIFISYKGVLTIPNIKKSRAIIWFAILPTIFYSVTLIGLILLLVNSY